MPETLMPIKGRVRSIPLLAAALAAVSLAMPATSAAQPATAYLDGAEPWTESDCASDVPVVVASDARAQSDIYSAVTLAGALGTDCVVLAGPREARVPVSQQARLDAAAAGGYVLGGTAAVPPAKIAGRTMTRLGGANRWVTAQRVGTEASALGSRREPASVATPEVSLTPPADVAQPGLYLDGAEPWIASDCAGDVPVVVASDARAQSDIYSAVTLAGVLGTDCVVLAGPRDAAMPVSQQARLDAAAAGGYVLGGTAAVPTVKVGGRAMTRLGGADRWATAQLVGRRATGDTTAGTSTAAETIPLQFNAIAVGAVHACGLRTDGTLACWGTDRWGETSAPSGIFTAVSAGSGHSCGVRAGGAVECWGNNAFGQADAPTGAFTAVAAGPLHSCGLRSSGTVACWGDSRSERTGAPAGTFTAVAAGSAHGCGLRTGGTVACWGDDASGQTDAPPGAFAAVAAGGVRSCGLRTGGTVVCWGGSNEGEAQVPSGTFTAVSVGYTHACGLRTSGTVACWGDSAMGRADPPPGAFTAVASGGEHSCGLRADATVACWSHRPVDFAPR
ncbi:RCC1 domain-containing protein [Candidatus Poriferisodalis sp.]|uniref:RCC1 domain-containing protein n=1 Tax=Candidatus Poriferisodalis sp. TaxID=3101277 RepID=UPI003B01F571